MMTDIFNFFCSGFENILIYKPHEIYNMCHKCVYEISVFLIHFDAKSQFNKLGLEYVQN